MSCIPKKGHTACGPPLKWLNVSHRVFIDRGGGVHEHRDVQPVERPVMDWRDGQMREGKVVQMRDTQVVLHEAATRREWKLPYAAIEPPSAGAAPVHSEPAQPASAPLPQREDFRCGDKVAFEDKYLNTVVGTIVRINQRTASIDPGDGTTWRVGFALLRRVIDI